MKITWFGTASILLESEGEKLLFDPFVQLAGGSNPNSLEDFPADTDICITHGHVDHLFPAGSFGGAGYYRIWNKSGYGYSGRLGGRDRFSCAGGARLQLAHWKYEDYHAERTAYKVYCPDGAAEAD